MKLILSRKGFDSAAGRVPSPILPDGRLLSLPIPDRTAQQTYAEVCRHAGFDEQLVEHLTGGRIRSSFTAHLDPDLRHDSLPRPPEWRPLFGQTRAAQAHLANRGVGPGDIFLFYGWFRQTTYRDGVFRFDRSAPDLHMLFGWLQVDDAHRIEGGCPATIPWAAYHPHFQFLAEGRAKNNTLYVAGTTLKIPGLGRGQIPGGGVFCNSSDNLPLTAPGQTRGIWLLPKWFSPAKGRPPLSYHDDQSRWESTEGGVLLRTASRGQEFVLDLDHYPEGIDWVRELAVGGGAHAHCNGGSGLPTPQPGPGPGSAPAPDT